MKYSWSDFPLWKFCQVPSAVPTTQRYMVKIIESHENPFVSDKQKDGPLVLRTLVNQSNKLVGYSFTFRRSPKVRDFAYSLGVSYGVPDTENMLVVLGSPHLRVIRYGDAVPVYHVVLRRK